MDPRHPPLNDGVPAGPGPAPPGLPSAGHRLSGRRAALAGRGGGVCLPSPPQRITGQRGLSGREEACEPNHRRRPRPSLAQPGLPLRAPGPAPTTGPRVVSAPPPRAPLLTIPGRGPRRGQAEGAGFASAGHPSPPPPPPQGPGSLPASPRRRDPQGRRHPPGPFLASSSQPPSPAPSRELLPAVPDRTGGV